MISVDVWERDIIVELIEGPMIRVHNLPETTTSPQIQTSFGRFGTLRSFSLDHIFNDGAVSSTTAIVTYASEEGAEYAHQYFGHLRDVKLLALREPDASGDFRDAPTTSDGSDVADEEDVDFLLRRLQEELDGSSDGEEDDGSKESEPRKSGSSTSSEVGGAIDVSWLMNMLTENACRQHRHARDHYYRTFQVLRQISKGVPRLMLTQTHLDQLSMVLCLSASRHTMAVNIVLEVTARLRASFQDNLYKTVVVKAGRRLKRASMVLKEEPHGVDYLAVPSGDETGRVFVPMIRNVDWNVRFRFYGSLTAPSWTKEVGKKNKRQRTLINHVIVPSVLRESAQINFGVVRRWYEGPLASNLVVHNLPTDFTIDQLIELFSPFGTILSANLYTLTNGYAMDTGFVSYADPLSVRKAVRSLHNQDFCGQLLSVHVKL